MPDCVFINRGNHEEAFINIVSGFEEELLAKYDHKVFQLLQKCFICYAATRVKRHCACGSRRPTVLRWRDGGAAERLTAWSGMRASAVDNTSIVVQRCV